MTTWTMRQSLFCLIGSTCLTTTLFFGGYAFFRKVQRDRFQDPSYFIQSVIQTGPEKEALKTAYLAELLDLSLDHPTHLFALDLKKAGQKLLSSPLIAKAQVQRMPPHTLYIDYEVRKPIARLRDYENVGVDREGFLLPLSPFFSPKELPEIYLGLPPFGQSQDAQGRSGGLWQTPVHNRHFDLALQILQFLEGSTWRMGLKIKRIDVSNAYASTLGQREIVLLTEEELIVEKEEDKVRCLFPKILRLSTKDYVQQVNNFFILQKNMMEDYRRQISSSQIPATGIFSPRIVDLRIPRLAFVENQS